ncbi:MAG: glycosyltransferase family 4 protein [Candidatus Poribacteria bacterium]
MDGKTTLLITFNFPPSVGGIETMLYHIMRNMPGKVIVMAPWVNGCDEFDLKQKFSVIRIRCGKASPSRAIKFLVRSIPLFKKLHINHIQSGNIYAALVSMVLSKVYNTHYSVYAMGMEIAIINTNLRSWLYKWLFRSVLKNASCVLSISDFTSNEVIKSGVSANKIFKIPCGIDTTTLDSFSQEKFEIFKKRVVKQYDLDGKKIILSISRLVPRKGHDLAILAVNELLRDMPDVTYIIVGGGPEFENCKKLVKKMSLDNNIKFTGQVPDEDIVNYYYLSDLFVLPCRHIKETSDVEGFGLVFLEANYCGRPVVGGNSGGIPDSVEHGKTGFIVDPADRKDIAQKIKLLLTNDDLRTKMGVYGRKRVIEFFNHDITVKKIMEGLSRYYS